MNTQELAAMTCDLIKRASVTPKDEGCQNLIGERLRESGFSLQSMNEGEVTNLWATHGSGAPLLVLAGHTDVVPPGDLDAWASHPFSPEVRGDYLYGRGAADMKASLAAMVGAACDYVKEQPQHPGTLAFLITSDEEGPAINGTRAVVAKLSEQGVAIDYCVVGEPSSTARLGDLVRNGRRGSINAELRVKGIQGHVAYPHLADNPIHASVPLLTRLLAIDWDTGNDYFPPTSLQIANLNSGTGATNVIPADTKIGFNLRFNTEQSATGIQQRVAQAFADVPGEHEVNWTLSGEPFLTEPGALTAAVAEAIERHCGYAPEFSTSGGTSDGRFIAPTGAEVVELGPVNATIHKVDERVAIADLEPLQDIYRDVIADLLASPKPNT